MTASELEKRKEDFIARFRLSTDAERINRTITYFDIEGLLHENDAQTDKAWDSIPSFGPKNPQEAMQRLQQARKDISEGKETPHEVFFKEIDNMISASYAKS
ncbi:MAG: hypothetical protein J6P44_03720 [Bacteroidales bacterium]|nr:hypothetical protein [Bacteroidales bacterium]